MWCRQTWRNVDGQVRSKNCGSRHFACRLAAANWISEYLRRFRNRIEERTAQLTDWLIDWLSDWLPDWLTVWLIACVTDCLADWLPAWLTDCLAVWLTYWLTDWLNVWLSVWLIACVTDWLPGCLTYWLTECLSDWLPVWLTMADRLPAWLTDSLTDCLTDWLTHLTVCSRITIKSMAVIFGVSTPCGKDLFVYFGGRQCCRCVWDWFRSMNTSADVWTEDSRRTDCSECGVPDATDTVIVPSSEFVNAVFVS